MTFFYSMSPIKVNLILKLICWKPFLLQPGCSKILAHAHTKNCLNFFSTRLLFKVIFCFVFIFSATRIGFKHFNSFIYSPTLTSIMTTGKTIALPRWAFAGKVMSLLFNILSRLVIIFLPRNKCLLISWLQSPSAVSDFWCESCMDVWIHVWMWELDYKESWVLKSWCF